MRTMLTLWLMCVWAALSSATLTVALDGTQDYTTVQTAINAAATGDTVLVWPGTYYENLVINTGITLGSLYLITGEEAYVRQTVLDGNHVDTVVRIEYVYDDSLSISGFTITHGYCGNASISRGGGVHIAYSDAVTITSCIIERNRSVAVGGIYLSYEASLYLANTTIRYNNGMDAGIAVGYLCNLYFDENRLCNLYLNYGQICELMKALYAEQDQIDVYVDTITVMNPLDADGYFFCSLDEHNQPRNDIIIHANHAKIEPVQADLYVAPDGDDGNSGLTPEEPLQRICHAMTIIASDSLNRYTIHLADGLYSETTNDQCFPVGMRNWVNIEGESMENTCINLDTETFALVGRYSTLRLGYYIKNLHFTQNSLPFNTKSIMDFGTGQVAPRDSIIVENILIDSCYTNYFGIYFSRYRSEYYGYPYNAEVSLKNIYILNNTAADAIYLHGNNVVAENIVVLNHEQIQDDYQIRAIPLVYVGPGEFTLMNSLITGCTNHCTDFNNAPGALGITNDTYYPGETTANIINCTIGDNHSDSFGGAGVSMLGGPATVNFYNTILYGDYPRELAVIDDIWTDEDSIHVNLYNCLINPSSVLVSSETTVGYNIGCFNADPLWNGGDDLPYGLQSGSPCIDTGSHGIPDSLWSLLPSTDLLGNARIYGEAIDLGCYEWCPGAAGEDTGAPVFAVRGNYPNPFNPTTTISYSISAQGRVEVSIYNVRGQLVKTLANEVQEAGKHTLRWTGCDDDNRAVSSGVYFYRVKAGNETETRKMLLLK